MTHDKFFYLRYTGKHRQIGSAHLHFRFTYIFLLSPFLLLLEPTFATTSRYPVGEIRTGFFNGEYLAHFVANALSFRMLKS